MSVKLKTVTKKESELQRSAPIFAKALESTTEKTDITTKLTLEIFVIVASIAILTVICYATYDANSLANSHSDKYPQCRDEVLEKARIGEVRGAEQVVSAFAKCK
jgi:heme/copper-type cytochrome/quinol oxidase subunit 2